MKDEAIVCNIGHFDNEIDVESLKKCKWDNISLRLIILNFQTERKSYC